MYVLYISGAIMRTVSASEAKQGLSSVIDAAAFEPVVIRKQKRDVAVVLSMREYARLTQLNVAEFQRYCDAVGQRAAERGMSEARLAELLAQDD
jgi:prevent-host-death family protein